MKKMADQWGRGQQQNYLNHHHYTSDDDPSFYEPPSYEQLNQSEATYSNEDYNYIQEGHQSRFILLISSIFSFY